MAVAAYFAVMFFWLLVSCGVLFFFVRSWPVILLIFISGCGVVIIPDGLAEKRYDNLCQQDSGMKINSVQPVDGFYYAGGTSANAKHYLGMGYAYIETDSEDKYRKGFKRIWRTGKVEVLKNKAELISLHEYSYTRYYVSDELSESDRKIVERATGQIIGIVKTWYFYGGPVFQRMTHSDRSIERPNFLSMCPANLQIGSLVDRTIPPKEQNAVVP